jgi:hypothetical protein
MTELAEFSKEGYGSKRVVLPKMMMMMMMMHIVQCRGYSIASEPQLYTLITEDTVRIGNSFITILNHT